MRLDMKDKKKICGEIAPRYQKTGKKGRGKLLDEYTVTLGYNRDYLAHILSNWGKTRYVRAEGKTVKIIATPAPQRGRKATACTGRKQGRKPKYQGAAFTALLEDIWDLFDCMCGKLLAPMLRLMLDFLTAEYSLTPAMTGLLSSVSPRTIDRILKPVKDNGRLRGLSLTKDGTLLRDQIPVRVMFNWDERKPGFFEFDRAARCGRTLPAGSARPLRVPMWVPAGPRNTPCSTAPIAGSRSGYAKSGTSCPSPSGVLTATTAGSSSITSSKTGAT
jgi:hypothetical protein